jgi:two-component system sensor histidine kinase/response regulator
LKTQRFTNSTWDRIALGTCLVIMLMALVVLVGWHAHVRAAVQIFRGLIPMQYNTALCFLALGAAGIGLLTGRRWLLLVGGTFAALMGAAVILEYASGISFGIDTLFFYPWERSLSADPGRMALTTAISFFLSGGVLVIVAVRRNAYAIFGIVNSIPLSLALTSLIGYSFQVTYVLPFSLGSQMALHTSAALLVYGIAMLGYAWKHAERGPDGLPKWCAGIGVAFLPVLLVGASAVFPKQSLRVVALEILTSTLVVALITLSVRTLTTAKVAYKGLLMIAVPLILLLIFVGLVLRMKGQSESAEVWALHSKEVIGISQSLLADIAETESAVRGYVISGDDEFANSYVRSLQGVIQTTTQLRNLVRGNPLQEANAIKIEHLTAQRMELLSQLVGLIKTGNKAQAEEEVKGRRGADLMNQIRTAMGVFLQEEGRLNAERRQILDTSWQRLSWLLVAGTAAAILLAGILTLLFSGGIGRRLQQLRDNAINLAAGKDLAPPLTGQDEIAELDRAFREMADSLEEVTRREKAVIDGTTDGIFVKDLNHRFLMMNQGGADQLGTTVQDLIGASVHDVFAPESAQRIVARDNEILASDKTVTYELVATTKAGAERTYLATRGPYRDRHGKVVGMIGVNRDISERKRSRQALATSERRYRAVVDEGQGLICTHDLDGKLLSVNPAAAESLGFTPGEMVGRNLVEYVTPAVQLTFPRYLKMIGSEQKVNGFLNLLNKQGEERIWMYRNVRIAEPGAVTYVLGYAQDVTESKRAEDDLRKLTQRLSLATKVGNIGVWDWDFETNILDWDERMRDIYGVAKGTVINRDLWTAAVVPEDLATAEGAVERALNLKSQEMAEFRILRPDGALRYVQTAQGVMLNRVGEVVRVIGLNVDITERKQLENLLRQERIFLRTLIDSIPDSIYVKDMAGRKVIANLAEVRVSGLQSESEVLGKDDFDLHPKELADKFFADDQVVLKTGQSVLNREEYVLDEQDQKNWLLTTKIPLRDENGKIVGLIGLGRDITARKQADQALKDSEARFRELFENASDLVCTMDLAGNLTSVNKSGERLTGYTRSEAVGMNLAEMVTPEMFVVTREMINGKLAQDVTTTYEVDIIRKDGSQVTLEISSRLLHQHGKETGIQAIGRDVTQRKQMEAELKRARDAALESVRLKSEFLANMSHEIRTPMNGVIGMTDLLLETDLSSTQREYTDTIQSSADMLLTIINDILDFSKIEAGLMRFEKIDFELRGAVEATVELLAERAQAKGLELASLVYRDVPTALRGDPGRLRQVLTNLIGNAVKFTDQGEVVVRVTKISETASDAVLRFEIQDTGIGVSAEAQQGLFRAFTQADGSTTRKYGGTGLGLAISKQLVELMGGQIGIESALGHGSRFWFTGRFEKQFESAIAAREPVVNLSGTRVLIVDDNATNRNILKHQTSSWGMIATEAESGEQALELLRAGVLRGEPYNIAVLDLMMPDMDGFQLAEAIKSDPTIARVTLVLLPSFVERGHGERARQAGIAAYLQKPVRQSQLYDCLTELSAQSKSQPVAASRLDTWHSTSEPDVPQKGKIFSSVRILIAEDNLVNQRVALGQLSNLGYRANAVPNGRELLKALEQAHVDIILMDCQMPEMDGFEATEEIRRREGSARHTTIIAMTANALDGDRERCLAAGMDDYLSKPVKSEVLRLKLELWIKPGGSGNGLSADKKLAPPTRSGVIDQTQLASLRAIQQPGAPDFVTELIDLFLNEATSDFQGLNQALTRDDEVEIRRVAHRLKGASANMGITHMAALSEELESKNPAKDSRDLMTQLENEFELVREALKAERR